MNKSRKTRVVMAVYNDLTRDGRVLRSAQALSAQFDVTVVSVYRMQHVQNRNFRSIALRLPRLRLLRQFALFYFYLRLILITLQTRPDIFYAHDYYLTIPALIISRLTRCRCVYDAHELIVPEAELPSSWRDMFFYRLERLLVPRANIVIAANEERAHIMRSHYGLPECPLVVQNIPPAPSPGTLAEMRQSILLRYSVLADRSRTRVVYQGVMTVERGIDRLIDAVAYLPDSYELLLVGDGPDIQQLRQRVQQSAARDRVIVLGAVPWQDLHAVVATGDIGVVLYPAKGQNNRFCASNKLFEYPQSGLPVVTTGQCSLRMTVNKYSIGLSIDDDREFSAGELASVIERVAADLPRFRRSLSRFLVDFSWHHEAKTLMAGVTEILPCQQALSHSKRQAA